MIKVNMRSILAALMAVHCVGVYSTIENPHKKMTVLLYMVADASQEAALQFNRQQIERVGVPQGMNVLIFSVITSNERPMNYYYTLLLDDETVKETKRKNVEEKSHFDLFSRALDWSKEFPADTFCLGVCRQPSKAKKTLQPSSFSAPFLTQGIKKFIDEYLGRPIDLMLFDAGLTGTILRARKYCNLARFLLVSQLPDRIGGIPYHFMMESFKQGMQDAPSLGCGVVNAFKYYYDILTRDYSAALLNLDALAGFEEVEADLELEKGEQSGFVKAVRQAGVPFYGAQGFVDFIAAAERVAQPPKKGLRYDPAVRQALAKGMQIVKKSLVCYVGGHKGGHGLSVQIPVQQQTTTQRKKKGRR